MHIGLIPDGNRRFMARNHIMSLLKSYDLGIKKFYDFLQWCSDLSVKEVTIYALSTENILSRGKSEVKTLYSVFNKHAINAVSERRLHDGGISVKVIGDLDMISDDPDGARMVSNLKKLEDATAKYTDFRLNLAIGYGGRQEIVNAVRKTLEKGLDITEENISDNLWLSSYPDIIIRTSEERLSNFLLWQSAYSEIYFVDKLWQEFEKPDLESILEKYRDKERRYGR